MLTAKKLCFLQCNRKVKVESESKFCVGWVGRRSGRNQFSLLRKLVYILQLKILFTMRYIIGSTYIQKGYIMRVKWIFTYIGYKTKAKLVHWCYIIDT